MELLINALLRRGAARDRLKVKLFGGGAVLRNLPNVGMWNAEFALSYVRNEGFDLVTQDLGGNDARRIQFWPSSGRARVSYLAGDDAREPAYPGSVDEAGNSAGDVELF